MARFDAFSSDQDSLFNYAKFSPSNGSLASLTMNDSTCVQKFRERSGRLFDIENEKNQLIQVSQSSIWYLTGRMKADDGCAGYALSTGRDREAP
jgi:hypothetical protein